MVERLFRKVRQKRLLRWLLFCYFVILPLFLTLIFDPELGRFLWLQHLKEQAREEVAEKISLGLNKDRLILLEFSPEEVKTELKWRSAQEFEFNHELYDVVDSVIEDNKVIFWCWLDQKESALEKEIELIISWVFNQQRNSLTRLEESIYTPRIYLFFPAGKLTFFNLNLISFFSLFSFKTNYFFESEPPTPPPRWLI
jgi:hypothetical protein